MPVSSAPSDRTRSRPSCFRLRLHRGTATTASAGLSATVAVTATVRLTLASTIPRELEKADQYSCRESDHFLFLCGGMSSCSSRSSNRERKATTRLRESSLLSQLRQSKSEAAASKPNECATCNSTTNLLWCTQCDAIICSKCHNDPNSKMWNLFKKHSTQPLAIPPNQPPQKKTVPKKRSADVTPQLPLISEAEEDGDPIRIDDSETENVKKPKLSKREQDAAVEGL